MKVLPVGASDQEILDAVREWVGMLIEERYAHACSFFYRPRHWTPELMRTVIENYGSLESWHDGEIFKVTPLEEAKADPPVHMPPRHEVNRYQDDPEIDPSEISPSYPGYVWFDLPLNGYWSDLTATLDLHVLNNQLVFELEGIHVM